MTTRTLHDNLHDDNTIDTGTPIPVAVDYVDAQLTQLWRNVAEAAQAKGGVSAVTMAQVLNIIVKADSLSEADEYVLEIEKITGSHPARVIAVITDPNDGDAAVQAWVSIHCQIPPSGGKQVCAEQIYVSAGGDAMRQVPAAVIPLLLPELPVFLWWPQESPFDEYIFHRLVDSLNRLIVDSATFENPEGTMSKMATRMKSDWPKLACTDMNWQRLTGWRELIAQFFDGAALRPCLDRIDRVTIDFALSKQGAPTNRAQALLLAGWLASRLGWLPVDPINKLVRHPDDPTRPASTQLYLQSGDRSIAILLRPAEQTSDVPGALQKVTLETTAQDPNSPPEASFEVCLSEKAEEAWTNVEVAGSQPSKRTVQLEVCDRTMLLDMELEVFSHDRIYDEALATAGVFIKGASHKEPDGSRKQTAGEPVSSGAQRPKRT